MITYPLNNVLYNAEDAELFHCTRSSGVFAGDDFAASVSGANNNISIQEGIAWIRNSKFSGKVAALKSPIVLDLGIADPSYPRIDAVVIQFDANKNSTEIVVKNGTPSSAPTPPDVVKSEALYELHLYHVRRDAGASVVPVSSITDLRANPDYCGLMSDDVSGLGDVYVESKKIGVANGVASLDSSGKVPTNQIPSLSYLPTSSKGAANGVASLDASGKIPTSQIPTSTSDYMPKSGGTFTGAIKAGSNYQTVGTSLLRNSKLVSSESYPSTNGEINWQYE